MISSSPSDESVKSCQEFSSKQWLQNGIQNHGCVGNGNRPNSKEAHIVTDKQEVRCPAYHKVYASSFSRSAVTKTTSVLQPLPAQNPLAGRGDESPLERRMNTNGYDRSRLTGPSGSGSAPNSESPAWLSEVSPPSHAHPPRAPVEGMLASRLISSQEGHLVLSSGSQGPQGPLSSSLFRPPATLFPGAVAQYSPSLYTTSSTGPLYSSSMYTLHGQPTPLASVSPYTSLYPQIAAAAATNYGHGSLLQSHYPQIESYSAVLAHMGSHVQQSQLPRSPYLTAAHLPQFSALSPAVPSASSAHAHMTAANTPHLPGHAAEILKPDSAGSKGKMGGDYESRGRLTSAPLPAPHAKSLTRPAPLSSPTHGKTGNKIRDAIKQERIGSPKDLAYKGVPCGKEGSLKHRILTRPPDIHIEGSSLPEVKGMLSARVKTEVSSPKRTKASASISHLPTVAEIGPGVNESGHSAVLSGGHPPQQAGSQPHYPAHFMKGSIIELASGDYKRVEDLQTEDFSNSAEISKDLKIDSSTVVRIQENYERGTALLSFSVGEHKVQVTVEATLEHPFFVFGRGWSSFSPARTLQRYELECHKLAVGDVCISLTHKDVTTHAAELNRQAADLRRKSRTGPGSVRFTTPTRVPPPSRVLSLEEGQQQLSIKDKERKPGDKDSAGSLLSGISLDDVPSRKRRWSAPDQVSLENEEAPPSKQSPGVRGSNSPGSEPSRGDT